MNAYFDSAVIAKLYVQESNSADAIRLVSADNAPFALTHWQEIEVRTALRLKLFRREITADELRSSLTAFDEDIGRTLATPGLCARRSLRTRRATLRPPRG